MKDELWSPGGVAFRITNVLFDDRIEIAVTLNFHDRQPTVRIIEPMVTGEGTRIESRGGRQVAVHTPGGTFRVDLLEGGTDIVRDTDHPVYRFPLPAMQASPLSIHVASPSKGTIATVRYNISLENTVPWSGKPGKGTTLKATGLEQERSK